MFVRRTKTVRANPALQMAFIRQVHVYISVFVAPSLLFFAFTGALQTFRVPDQKSAPTVIQKLARLHKDDVFAIKPPRPERPKAAGHDGADQANADRHDDGDHDGAATDPGKPAQPRPPANPVTELMKWFFTVVSIGIIFTTVLGLWMALAFNRRKLIVWMVLAAGIAAPVLIAAF
jgi:hypothetical protein